MYSKGVYVIVLGEGRESVKDSVCVCVSLCVIEDKTMMKRKKNILLCQYVHTF